MFIAVNQHRPADKQTTECVSAGDAILLFL